MTIILSQPPRKQEPAFDRWTERLWKKITTAAGIAWSVIDKTGSNLTDIQTRNHNDLQTIQGGAASEYYHLNAADYAMVTSTGLSAGAYTAPTVTDNGDGTITLGSGDYCFYADANGSLPVSKHTIAGALYNTLTDNSVNYIVADYNGGSPILTVLTSNSTFNYTTIYPIISLYRTGVDLDILDHDADGRALANKILRRLDSVSMVQIEPDGFALGEAATRLVTIGSGYIWNGINRVFNAAFNSSVDEFSFYYHVAGVWTKSAITQYNNSQYDDGTNLVALGAAKYAVNWIFKSARSDGVEEGYLVLGGGNYNLVQAQASVVPANLPGEITSTGFLVGRIIVLNGDTVATEIDSAFTANLNFAPNAEAVALVTTGAAVNVSNSAPPAAGYNLSADSATAATWKPWSINQNSIASGQTCTIPSGFQMLVYSSFSNSGTLANSGEMVIL